MALQTADTGYVLETGRITLTGTGAELLANEAVQAATSALDLQSETLRCRFGIRGRRSKTGVLFCAPTHAGVCFNPSVSFADSSPSRGAGGVCASLSLILAPTPVTGRLRPYRRNAKARIVSGHSPPMRRLATIRGDTPPFTRAAACVTMNKLGGAICPKSSGR